MNRIETLNIYYDNIIKPDLTRLEKFMKINKLEDFELIFNLIDTINAIEKHHLRGDKQ